MSRAANIVRCIKYMRKGQPFSIDHFGKAGSRALVAKTLSRLAASGELERLTRGIYMRPKFSRFAGNVRPSAESVLRIIAKRNREIIQVHGAEAVRAFSLSTQMQIKPVFYTSGASREVKIGRSTVRLLHVSPEKLQHVGTRAGLALCALFYLGKEGVNDAVITSIKAKLAPAELKQLTDSQIPVWMQVALRQAT